MKLLLEVVESLSSAYTVEKTFSVTIYDFVSSSETTQLRHIIGPTPMIASLTPFVLTYDAGFTTA